VALDGRLGDLRAALAASPYWSRRLRSAGSSPHDLERLDDLSGLPLLDRAELAVHWRDIADLRGDGDGTAVVLSSGSTGQPLPVPKDAYDQVHMWAVLRYWLRQLRIRLPRRPRVVLLCALPGGLAYSVRLPLLAAGALHRISLARPAPLAAWRRARPDVVFTDPAGLHWLANLGTGERPPRLVLSSAQHLGDDLRRRAAEALAAPIVDYYATTETGPVAWRCPASPAAFHVLLPDVWVESVGGQLAVTRLRPSGLVLLRYLPGDRGRVVRADCPCGVRGVQIHDLEGRHPSLFAAPDGRTVDGWQLAWAFKQEDVRRFQLRQVAVDRFVAAVAEPGAVPDLVERLTSALRCLGWPQVHVELASMDASAAAKHAPCVPLPG
jgi:phenylacetate-CoA ligase